MPERIAERGRSREPVFPPAQRDEEHDVENALRGPIVPRERPHEILEGMAGVLGAGEDGVDGDGQGEGRAAPPGC